MTDQTSKPKVSVEMCPRGQCPNSGCDCGFQLPEEKTTSNLRGLKPCPFCDSVDLEIVAKPDPSPPSYPGGVWVVECYGCGALGPICEEFLNAPKAWNDGRIRDVDETKADPFAAPPCIHCVEAHDRIDAENLDIGSGNIGDRVGDLIEIMHADAGDLARECLPWITGELTRCAAAWREGHECNTTRMHAALVAKLQKIAGSPEKTTDTGLT